MPPEVAVEASRAAQAVLREDLEGRLDTFILDRMAWGRREFVLREVAPTLTWNRLDLAIKLFYLEQSATHPSSFAQELYDAHIHAFSLGDFREPGNDVKVDAATFRSTFESILKDMRNQGFDPARSLIPAASDGSFINGGHRTACAMFLGRNVHVVETGLPPVRYDYRFFRNRGMSDDLLEAAVVRYVERSPRARVALVEQQVGFASKLESSVGPMVYKKRVALSSNGAANLVDLLDRGPALAAGNPNEGQRPGPRLPGWSGSELRLFVYVFDHREDEHATLERRFNKTSEDGRGLFLCPNSHDEALDLTRLLLNDRSIAFLNRAVPSRFPSTADLARRLRHALDHSRTPREMAVLDSGMVLAAYGVRETGEAAFMSPSPLFIEESSPALLRRPCDPEIHDILQDPRRHFHYWGLKFLSPAQAMETVAKRRPLPSSDDLRLLVTLVPSTRTRDLSRRVLYAMRLRWARVRRTAIHAVLRLGLREQAKWAYDRLRRR